MNCDAKYFFIPMLIVIAIALILGCDTARADADDRYVGVHITVPFTLDGAGIQVLARYDNTEYRAGYDSNHNWQVGAGITAFEEVIPSMGMAYSSYQGTGLPYIGVRSDVDNDYEYGIVSYGLNQPTTYGFIGFRFDDDGDSDDNNGNNSGANDDGSNGSGDGDSDNGSGGDGEVPDDGDDGGSDDDTRYAGNRSGHGDGTNPGKGSGKTNSPNTGASNPHH